MIEPLEFYSNTETHSSNHYQKHNSESLSIEKITNSAILEFNNLKNKIQNKGIKVKTFKGIKGCPDHIFPNWVATFEDKTMHLFPMMAPNRRLEKTPQMIDELSKEYKLVEDLSHYEQKNIFLESTSSIVFDFPTKIRRKIWIAQVIFCFNILNVISIKTSDTVFRLDCNSFT